MLEGLCVFEEEEKKYEKRKKGVPTEMVRTFRPIRCSCSLPSLSHGNLNKVAKKELKVTG